MTLLTSDNASSFATEKPPLRIGVLNLMPKKHETEQDIIRCLSGSDRIIDIRWLRLETHVSKTKESDEAGEKTTYQTLAETLEEAPLDGLIITGTPIGHLKFEEVTYWEEFTDIIDFARAHIPVTLYLCWAAIAASYHFYQIPKVSYFPSKISGIFSFANQHGDQNPFSQGIDPTIQLCLSRHTGPDASALQARIAKGELVPLFSSADTPAVLNGQSLGTSIYCDQEGKSLYNLGHFEYHAGTIDAEVRRDRAKTPPLVYPVENYYRDEQTLTGLPDVTWEEPGRQFFWNMLQACTHD